VPAVLEELLQLSRMVVPKGNQLGKDLERLGPQVMFDGFDFLLDGFRT
jgi:hypothetical protein